MHGEEAKALRESDEGRRGDGGGGDGLRVAKRRRLGGGDAAGGGIARFFGAPQPPNLANEQNHSTPTFTTESY